MALNIVKSKEVVFTDKDWQELRTAAFFFEGMEATLNRDAEINMCILRDVLMPGIKLLMDLNVRIAIRFEQETGGAE